MEFRTFFVKNGVEYRAEDYGHKAWPFGGGKNRHTKKTSRTSLRKKVKRQV